MKKEGKEEYESRNEANGGLECDRSKKVRKRGRETRKRLEKKIKKEKK